MSILGNLIVTLSANTASFVEGMTGASKTARTAGREIESAFSTLGSVASTALAPFGQMGAMVANTLGQIGSMAGTAITSIGKMSGGTGALAVAVGAVVGASAAVTLASIGLATHTAESIAKLNELAQASGISVESLSALAFAGKNVGIETDTMAKIIQKMDKAVMAAATAPGTASNAFTRLHVAVKDASGEIRPATEIMADLAGKFSAMPDGVTKTALALQIFGRGGAQIIPLLNRGKEGLEEFTNTAQALGVVIDGQTAAAATKFKEDLVTIEAAGQGAAIRLTKDLLPALDFLAGKLVESFKTGQAQAFIDKLAWITKATIAIGNTFFHVFDQIGIIFEGIGGLAIAVFNAIGASLEAVARAGVGDFSGAKKALKEGYAGLKQETDNFLNASKKTWQDNANFINGVFAPGKTLPVRSSGGSGGVDLKAAKEDTTLARIQERIAALGQEAKDWANLASAGTQAEAMIAEATKKGNAEFGKLKAEAAKDKTGAALPFVLQNEDMIKAAAAEGVFGAAIKKLTIELDGQKNKLGEEGKAAVALGAAYQQGGAAIAAAAIDQKFADQAAKVNVLEEVHDRLAQQWGKDNPIVLQLAASVSKLTQTLEANKNSAAANLSQALTNELKKQNEALILAKPYVDKLNASYFKSEDAIRAARIELELYQFEQEQLNKGIVVTQAQITQKRTLLTEADREAYESSLKQSAAQYDLNRLYDEQIVKLRRVREVMQQNGSNTLLVDARLFDAQEQLMKQWDEAAFKVGTFGQKTTAVFNEIILQGQHAGQAIAQAFIGAYDSLTGALAKLATGQKADFKSIFRNLAEQVTKAEIQKGIGSLTQSLGLGKIPGLSAKADGSESNPFYVISKGGAAGQGGGALTGLLAGLFSGGKKPSAGDISSLFGGPSQAETTTSSLPDFDGLFALGGDISSGHWGVAGDKGPEIVKGPATVLPMSKLGGGHQTSITNIFNGLKDNDMMRRSQSQMVAQQHRQMSIAYARS